MNRQIIELHPCKKQYTLDQDKACSPEETVKRFLAKLQELDLDILEEVRRIDTGRLDIPVFFSVCGRDARGIIGTRKQMGKGSTVAQSRASACMELGERFSFFSFLRNEDRFLVGDYQAMLDDGHPVLALEQILRSVHDTSCTPELLGRLLAGLPIRWVWARNLTREEDVLVPFSWFYAINEFNGPSAGNTMEEAVLQGISEVVERHVCAVVTRERLQTPSIDPASVGDPVARDLIAKFHRCGIRLYLNDFSLDTGIPTVAALAWDPATFPDKSEIVYTAGTTPDPTKALIRALTEVAQLAGDFESASNYVASGLPKPLHLDEVDHVVHGSRVISIDRMPDLSDPDMYREIQNCVQALAGIDLDVLVVDTTHPGLQIPAAYTIIPGAHFRERAAGGDAALFAARLAADLLEPAALDDWLVRGQKLVPAGYYFEFYRGRTLYEQGETESALGCFQKAMELDPREEDRPYLHSYAGSCLRDLGRFEEAITVLEQGLALDEERPDIHNILGVCHFRCDRYEQAADHFQRAVELNPVSAIDYANLALNQQRLGRTREAITNYQIALSQDPKIEFARKGLAELLEQVAGEA